MPARAMPARLERHPYGTARIASCCRCLSAGETKSPLRRGLWHSGDTGGPYSLAARMSRSHWYQPSRPEPSRQETSNTASSLLRRVAKARARSRSKST